MHKRYHKAARWPLLVSLLVVFLVIWQQQAIKDWFKLYGYEPPHSLVQMADDIALTDNARHLLYVNRPQIQDRSAFQSSCSKRGEQTIVLGCYHPVDRGIYIFHVTDDRLAGVDRVTLAHEVLHAGYDRLKPSQKQRINQLLMDYNDNQLRDERIRSIVASYQKTEPNDVVNEMHSIFATEVETLPAELEEYYRGYFKDRAKVVGHAGRYQAEFTSRQQQVVAFDKQLEEMKQRISTSNVQLDKFDAQITALRAQMDEDRASDNIDEYNAAVPVYNSLISRYNGLVVSTKSLISQYNELVSQRNEVAVQVSELAHSIDSSFQAID
jgi:hypothetical protein